MDKQYFQEILDKYDFISALYVTDSDGVVLVNLHSTIRNFIGGNSDEFEKRMTSLKTSLAFFFNSQIDQITRIEKWKTKYITTIYDTLTIFQTKISKTLILHFICETNRYNSNILKDICSDMTNKFKSIEKDLEALNSNMELNV